MVQLVHSMKKIFVISLLTLVGINTSSAQNIDEARILNVENDFQRLFQEEVIDEIADGKINAILTEQQTQRDSQSTKKRVPLNVNESHQIYVLRLVTRLFVLKNLESIVVGSRLSHAEMLTYISDLGSFTDGFADLSIYIDQKLRGEQRFDMPSIMKDEIRSTLNLVIEFAQLDLPLFTIREKSVLTFYRRCIHQDRIELKEPGGPEKFRILEIVRNMIRL